MGKTRPKRNNIHSFIVTAKIKPVSKNISAANAAINLPRMHLPVSLANHVRVHILTAPRYGTLQQLPLLRQTIQPFVFMPKPTSIALPSVSKLYSKTDFKRMRYPVHIILMALSMFYLGKNSFRNIALILQTAMNIQVSYTTISNWCARFAPLFHLSPHRDSPQAFTLFDSVKHLGMSPTATARTMRRSTRLMMGSAFGDDITNNLIECFNKQFKT